MKKPIPNSICDDCLNTECVQRAPSWGTDPPVTDCPDKKAPPITNADRVRAMTDEELAEWYWRMLHYIQGYTDSRVALREWLKEEYKE